MAPFVQNHGENSTIRQRTWDNKGCNFVINWSVWKICIHDDRLINEIACSTSNQNRTE